MQEGSTGAGETYTCNTSGVITFGTTNITFAQISSAQIYSAGTGLTLSGTQFSITNTGTAGTYGSASAVPVFTTNAQGQVTSVTNTAIAITGAAVSGNIAGQAGSVANALTAGTYLTSGGTYDGSAARTFAVDATSANTVSKVVARDSSGNFSAGTITATLSGAATSATTATNLAGGAANQIAYQTSSGTTNFAVAPTVSSTYLFWNGSAFAWGAVTSGTVTSITAGTYLTGGTITTSGTIAVDATSANTASKVVARDASGNFSAGTITASLSGNATTASTAGSITSQANSATITATSNNTANQIVLRDGSGNFSAGTITATLSGNASTATSATTAGSITSQANSATITATSTNTANQIVLRDGSGNFSAGTITASLAGNATTATTASSTSGNAATATALSSGQSNWSGTGVLNNVVGMLAWKNYGNGHVIFDASNATSPSGGSVNSTNSAIAWTAGYPTLMGWNGANTYGVRVDSARVADAATTATTATNQSGGTVSATSVTTSGPILRSAAGAGYLNGNYAGVETINTSGAIYSIGGVYVPGTTTLGNMYGVGYTYSGSAAGNPGGAPSNLWGMYVASGGTARIFLDSDNGRGYFASNLYVNGGTQVVYNSGTWGISITGNAATITSQANSATITASTAANANQIVLRDGNGDDNRRYGFASYFNSSDDVSSGNISHIMAKFGDNYYRSATAAKVATFISGQTMNISGSATTATTATNIAGGAAGRIPYNTGAGATAFTATGTSGQVLQSNGSSAPTWVAAPGPQAGGVIYENNLVISSNYTLTANKNGMSVGPITINSGVSVTVPSGQRWLVL